MQQLFQDYQPARNALHLLPGENGIRGILKKAYIRNNCSLTPIIANEHLVMSYHFIKGGGLNGCFANHSLAPFIKNL